MVQAKALVVDDHKALSDNIIEILETGVADFDLDCQVATNIADGLALAEEDLDLALVDLHLPDGEGISLINELRQRAPFAQCVVITGDATVESAIGALDKGAFGYVLKPFNAPDLLETAGRAIERARLLRETEQLRVQLEQSEERHRTVIESVPAFVTALDYEGNIVLWNRRLEEATGMSQDEMIGKHGEDYLAGSDAVIRLPTAGGGHRMVRWQLSRVESAEGDAPFTFAVGIDVTEEREAQRRAARAERLAAVGTLAAGLAHEVRNPLNSASLQLQVLERRIARGETSPDKVEPVVTIVHDEIRRLAKLVSEFLSFARPAPMELRPVALNEVLTSVLELTKPECDAEKVEQVAELDPDVGLIQGDQERLRQVFLNVVRNAVEAMKNDGRLTVRTTAADRQGDVRVEIQDNGPGFAEGAPVFDAFYTTKEQGTGLGLAIVHSIVTEHGGTIEVDSEPGRTVVTIALPQPAAIPGP